MKMDLYLGVELILVDCVFLFENWLCIEIFCNVRNIVNIKILGIFKVFYIELYFLISW